MIVTLLALAAATFPFLQGHSLSGPFGVSEHPSDELPVGWQQQELVDDSPSAAKPKAPDVQQQNDCPMSVVTISSSERTLLPMVGMQTVKLSSGLSSRDYHRPTKE